MKIAIKIGLWVVVVVLAYLVYNSIAGKIDFENETKNRRDMVIERLKDIRIAQLAYKTVNDRYDNNFKELLHFVKNDSFPLIMAIGMVPDTLSEDEAVQMGIVTRDTSYQSIKDSIFSPRYLKEHLGTFYIDSLPYIPFSKGEVFEFEAGKISKGMQKINVFRIFAAFGKIYIGMNTTNEAIDLEEGLSVGSMTESSTSGNWGE